MFVSINTLGEEAVHLHDLHIFFFKKKRKIRCEVHVLVQIETREQGLYFFILAYRVITAVG